MKKLNLNTLTCILGLVSLLLIGACNEASKSDMKDANEDMKEANAHLKDAAEDMNDTAKARTNANWQEFKKESEDQITVMEKQLQDLNVKIGNAKQEEKARLQLSYDKTSAKLKEMKEALNQRNIEFEKNMDQMDESMKEKNESFKREFKHDMNELGESFRNLFKDNVK